MSIEVHPPKVLRVSRLSDLARFAASLATLGSSVYIVYFPYRGKHIYGLLTVYRDYYKYYGIPMFYYFEASEKIEGDYILVRLDEKERIEVANGTKPGWMHIPVISLKEKPDFIEIP